jgi:voltage-gated potassium channel
VKSLGLIFSYLSAPQARRNVRIVLRLLGVFIVMVALFSTVFHVLMDREGQQYSWPTSIYWTIVTMSTLGFGDITFESDTGRLFSVLVLLSGSFFILVLMPFTFIQFVYVPWMDARQQARAPRQLPEERAGHVVLTSLGPIEDALISRLRRSGIGYTVLTPTVQEALPLHDRGYDVMVGPLDDPSTYRSARVEQAVLVATTGDDTTNTNVAFTVREITQSVSIVATASSAASVDILELAGCNSVLQLGDMLGRALARRVLGPDARCQVVGEFGDLLIAESAAAPTALTGKTVGELDLRRRTGITVAGIWDRGRFHLARPDTHIGPSSVLVLAGSREQLDAFDESLADTCSPAADAPVVIIGGGRVGRSTGRELASSGMSYRIIERNTERIRDPDTYIVGDAAELEVLQRAGIQESPTVVITTHDDDVNVYLTIYCRRLRPDVQIIARANLDRNVSTLHRAGADSVLSYASTGATAIWNVLSSDDTLQLAEGLDVFRVQVPEKLHRRTLATSGIRESTGCHVVALVEDGRFETNPAADRPLPDGGELVLIGDSDAEQLFYEKYQSSS